MLSLMKKQKLKVVILIFDDVEVLDFAGPFEVFSVAGQLSDYKLLDVSVVGKSSKTITAKNGLKVVPDADITQAMDSDILVIPGGDGSKAVIEDLSLLSLVKNVIDRSQICMSVCSGARILAKLGYLDGKEFATHQSVYDDVMDLAKNALPQKSSRFVDLGQIMTAAGVAAGIDLALHVVQKVFGKELMQKTADYMEYPLNEKPA